MPADVKALRSEAFVPMGEVVRRDAGAIVERWCRRVVEEQPKARRVHHETLKNDLPRFLEELGQSLAAADDAEDCGHCRPARDHGSQRWEAGWSLGEVVQDYQVLRLVLLEYLEETLDRPLQSREVRAMGLELDEAIAASVGRYVRHRDEQTREQAEGLQDAHRRKDEFLALLGHELRNPLAPLRNALQVLALRGGDAETRSWARSIMERQLHHLTRMVDDLLDVSRISLGKIDLRSGPIDLAAVAAAAVEATRPLIDARGHRLSVELPRGPLRVRGDATRLTQVLVNLLTNAAKYTPEGGQIRLAAGREGDGAVVRVRDNGVGIPPEMLPKVFDLFIQVEQSLERSQGGLGIGLTLVQRLVELHGGSVAASSEGVGKGSEFAVRLPLLADEAAGDAGGAKGEPVPPAARRILVVEDNKDSAESLAMLLRLQGHEVATAHDGTKGLEEAARSLPGVVLLDIGLPGLSGYDVARRLRATSGLEKALLIALTGYGGEADRQRSHEAGFNAHLVKPVDPDELNELLAGAEWSPPPASPGAGDVSPE